MKPDDFLRKKAKNPEDQEAQKWIIKDFYFDDLQYFFDNACDFFMNYKFYRWGTLEEAKALKGKKKWKSLFF